MFRAPLIQRFLVILSSLLLSILLSVGVFPSPVFAASSVTLNPTQGSAGTQVTASGSSWTPSHQITVTLEDGTNLGNTTVQGDGSFTVSFTIPTDAAQGNLNIDFADGTGNLGFFIPVTFTVTSSSSSPNPSPPPAQNPSPTPPVPEPVGTPPPPLSTIDLETIDIQSLQPLAADSNVTFRANIRNNGSAASGDFNIRWIADGKNFDGGHFSIPAGAVDTHDHIWNQGGMGNLTPGQHTLTFIANFDHGIPESNYDNNQFTLTFTVSPTPDPMVTPIQIPLQVPYISQFEVSNRNLECGPTAVAMILKYFNVGPTGSNSDRIKAVRKAISDKDGNNADRTSADELQYALSHFGVSYPAIFMNVGVSDQIEAIKQATNQGHPVIAFLTESGGHWVVVTGISNDNQTVYLNNPDETQNNLDETQSRRHPTSMTMSAFQGLAQQISSLSLA